MCSNQIRNDEQMPMPLHVISDDENNLGFNTARRKKRNVRFSPSTQVVHVCPCSEMSKMNKNEIWYDCDELLRFRRSAKETARFFQVSGKLLSYDNPSDTARDLFRLSLSNPNLDFSVLQKSQKRKFDEKSIEYHGQVRGLEHRINLQRQRNRYITRQAILEAQRRLKLKAARKKKSFSYYADSLADVAGKFSRWAREIARETGIKDELAVSGNKIIPQQINVIDPIEFIENTIPCNHQESDPKCVRRDERLEHSPHKKRKLIATPAIVDISLTNLTVEDALPIHNHLVACS